MSTRNLKLHYNQELQVVTNVDIWRYKYDNLIRDIMGHFLPQQSKVTKFKIECAVIGGDIVLINDNESLRRCLLFGDSELNIHVVEVIDAKYDEFVDEVDDIECDGVGVNEGNAESQSKTEDEEDSSEILLSTDNNEDEDSDYLNNEDEVRVESDASLDEEKYCEDSDDKLSDVDSDGEGVARFIDDEEFEKEMEQLQRATAGTWFKREADNSIKLAKGQLFDDVYHFREILKEYIIQEGFEVLRKKNEKSRVTVICQAEGCTWRVHASPIGDEHTYKIKTYCEEHTCLRNSKFREATNTWIAAKLHDKFAADLNKSRASIEQDLIDMYGITGLKPMKLYRSRQKARKAIEGDHFEQYAKLRGYLELILKSNPGSVVNITPYERHDFTTPPQFKRLFLMFAGVKKAFMEGCRPFIGVDGCFLKGPYGGMLLSAIALDGNNGVLPLAFCIAEAENRDSWLYFFGLLRDAIGDDNEGTPWTIISDRQKGLVDAVQLIFPNAIQRFCLFHIDANFKLKFQAVHLVKKLWAAGRACNAREFDMVMQKMKEEKPEAYDWLMKIPVNLWSKHAFKNISKVSHISNNISESLNSWLNKVRDKPIITLLEAYRLKVMNRLHGRYRKACERKGKLVPKAIEKINKRWSTARKLEVFAAGHGEFQCKDGLILRVVNLKEWSCDCGCWDVCGIPCKHAIACIRMCNEEVQDYCHVAYHVQTYFKVYNNVIHPQPDIGVLSVPTVDVLQPPPLKRRPGRPRKKRKLQPSEKISKQRSTIIRCSNCKQVGHNIRGCQKAPAKSSKRNDSQPSSSNRYQAPASSTSYSQPRSEIASSSQTVNRSETTTKVKHMRPKLPIRSKAKTGPI